ncbi:hypothetical protein GCM10023221_26490 [Luteimicrobium xylanilyticum]|uniref:Htaa domain-containing protein n=1 Tax=Luteimicrobium xylanilyticum TaxID=1133546 RepID=A0A5P9QE86_9MICO|nr:hypothetical protein [Luteimicrobium xylanilyticum]QFU99774.1 hypothetical protein KDY119_03310 [Luteimicrobium xylanilyticum]
MTRRAASRASRAVGRVAALVLATVALGAPLAAAAAAPAHATSSGGVAADDDVPITVTVPGTGKTDGPFTVSDASLRWALNAEAGSGAYFGGCNFLMAGRPGTDGNTHGGKVWTDATYYHATAGKVSVEKPDAKGVYRAATFASRCLAPDGKTAVSTGNGLGTGTQVVVDGGTGTVDPDEGTATIRWKGTFTSVFYGGLTYWWASDPVLTVEADGTGTLTATAGGYGTSMEDQSKWDALPATTVVLADLERVPLTGAKGFKVVPAYVGTAVTVPAGATAQAVRTSENASYWGSFPQSFVDFQARTGQLSYWFASGGQRDPFKVAAPVYVSYDADAPVEVDPGDATTGGGAGGGSGDGPTNTVTEPPASSGATGGGPDDGAAGATGTGSPAAGPGSAGAGTSSALDPVDPVATDPGQAAFAAAAAPTVGGSKALVPALTAAAPSGGDVLTYATAGLLVLAAGAVHGFRRGWLVLPFLG